MEHSLQPQKTGQLQDGLTDYRKIRQLVLGDATVMQSTTLQLCEISHTTLVEWHNKRLKRQCSSILPQGVNSPASNPVVPAPLPPVQVRPTAAPPRPGPQHQYHLPHSTAGLQLRGSYSLSWQLHLHLPVVLNPSPVIAPLIFQAQSPGAQQIIPSGLLHSAPPARRTYTRTVDKNECSQCQQPCDKDTGHRQYYGHILSPKSQHAS